MIDWQSAWKRLEDGQHVVLQDNAPISPPPHAKLRIIRVDCQPWAGPNGALDEAYRRLQAARGKSDHRLIDAAAQRLKAGLRRHLLGETLEGVELGRYAQALSRDAGPDPAAIVLVLQGVEHADPASLILLTHLLTSPHTRLLPVLFIFESRELAGAAARLHQALRERLPPEAFCSSGSALAAPVAQGSELAARASGRLGVAARQVLRAAATIGEHFESCVIAELLDLDELAALAALQEAVDEGLAVEDRGEGLFRMAPALRDELRADTLPSLTRAWHERLSQTFGGPPGPLMSPLPRPESSSDVGSSPVASAEFSASGASSPSGTAEATTDGSAGVGAAPHTPESSPPLDARDLFAENAATPDVAASARDQVWGQLANELAAVSAEAQSEKQPSASAGAPQAALDAAPAPTPPSGSHAASDGPADAHRAAIHAESAGLWTAACQHHLEAARRATLAGSHSAAAEYAGRALALTHQIGDPEQRRSAQISGLLLLGRALWQAPSNAEESSLHAALSALSQCRALLVAHDAPELHAEIGCLIAHIEYDVGTPRALEHALEELTRAGQLLLAEHRPLDAARLLNDEAAVWVKLGDPVRAYHLLQNARETWSRVLGSHPAARTELAETEHLLARLLLQAPGRPGRERDALQLGLEHARVAEEAYRETGDAQEIARVWETLGRLMLGLGNLDLAAQHIENAHRLETELGDGVGLARSAAAAADIQAARHDYSGALESLGESIALNMEKGLMAGLEFNRISLQQMDRELPTALRPVSRALEQRLQLALGHGASGAA